MVALGGAGGHAWLLRGGVCGCLGAGACVVAPGGHAWFLPGGMHGFFWGGMCGFFRGGGEARIGYDEIRSISGRYASYWNAFLFYRGLSQNKVLALPLGNN